MPSDDDSWTAFPIVYQNEIRDPVSDEAIRMDFDSIGQARLVIQNGEVAHVHALTDEQCHDLMHLIMRGLNHVARHQRQGWAA